MSNYRGTAAPRYAGLSVSLETCGTRRGQKLQTVSRASASSAVDRTGANTCAQVAHYQRASLRGSQLSWNAFKLSLTHSLSLSLSCPHSKPSSRRCLFVRLRILDTRRRSRARPTRKCCQQCYTVGIHGNALVQPAQLECGIAEPAMFCFRVLSVSYLQG